ncbi:MAG: electron transfer flavoprotein subunit beta/FixA family protein [Bacilli bacterium]|nr:electron transfer flavoprotein subunit beta/FixA family protein [Bacilli bacterium]
MNILVCIKQVPASSNVKIDPVTGTLIRDGSNVKMNPYDLFALEMALLIKEKKGAHVKAITMGPPMATSILNEALYMGCDEGILITDRKFGGADVVATSYTIMQGIKASGDFDLIICGKQTTDGDTAQVGAEIAEHLNIPHVCYVNKIIEIKDKSIVVETSLEETIETLEINYPCLITIEKDAATPRLPSYKRSLLFKDAKFRQITFNDLSDKDENHYGLKGSPTRVEKMFNPEKNDKKTLLTGDNDKLVNDVKKILMENKLL